MRAIHITCLLCCCALLGSCTEDASVARASRLVILYAPCTVNRNYLSPYAGEIAFTPRLRAFSEEAVTFTAHYTEAGQSGIAYASLFTGAQADHHGVFRHPTRISQELYLIGEAFADHGFDGFYWNGHKAASADLNYAQGFPRSQVFPRLLRAESKRFRAILERLRDDPGYRAFVVTNFSVTHGPYGRAQLREFLRVHPEERGTLTDAEIERFGALYHRHHDGLAWNFPETLVELGLGPEELARLVQVVDLLYRSNVFHLDRLFGAVVAAVDRAGLRDEALIAFTADHGEVLYRDNALFQWSHGFQLAPEVLAVPLLLRAPALGAGARIHSNVSRSIDVFPTLAGLSGFRVEGTHGIQGIDLGHALRGATAPPALRARFHTSVLDRNPAWLRRVKSWSLLHRFHPDDSVERIWVGSRQDGEVFKYRNLDGQRWGMQAFDAVNDPQERENRFTGDRADHAAAARDLADYRALLVRRYEHHEALAAEEGRTLPDDEKIERLRALGYVD